MKNCVRCLAPNGTEVEIGDSPALTVRMCEACQRVVDCRPRYSSREEYRAHLRIQQVDVIEPPPPPRHGLDHEQFRRLAESLLGSPSRAAAALAPDLWRDPWALAWRRAQ